MASKKDKGEPVRWVTVKGARIPIYLDENGKEVFGAGVKEEHKKDFYITAGGKLKQSSISDDFFDDLEDDLTDYKPSINIDDVKIGHSHKHHDFNKSKTKPVSRNAKYDTSRVSYVQKSVASLKTMYKNATPEDKKRIAAEMNARGYYYRDGKWVSHK